MSALDLARELVALPGWEWLDGMRALDGDQRCGYRLTENSCLPGHPAPVVDDSWLPDLSDPATLGALLGLVRERLDEHSAHVVLAGGRALVERDAHPRALCADGSWFGEPILAGDEAAALVAALRAAGVRS